jgi:uracil-DNA glycosylase
MTVNRFVNQLSAISLPNVFNPYRDICSVADHPESAVIRRRNLTCYCEAMQRRETRMLWLGRDLGYRGGRRTGIALTDEFHLDVLVQTYQLTGVAKATADPEVKKERTATEVWKLLIAIQQPVFLWNVFPFHPFDADKPFTNRRHTGREFDQCADILIQLVTLLCPTTIVVLGADAGAAAARLGLSCERVRHPSYGGQFEFARAIRRITGTPIVNISKPDHRRRLSPAEYRNALLSKSNG